MVATEFRKLRFNIPHTKVLVVKFPEELTKDILENLKDDFNMDFPSSIIYEIEPVIHSKNEKNENEKNEKNKICIIVPENDINGVKEFFFGYEIEDKYNLYIAEDNGLDEAY